jgi:hypothetical protein
MLFHFNRRVGLFILLDTVVILGIIGIFTTVNHANAPSQPALSDRIFRTPEPIDGTSGSTKATPDKQGKSSTANSSKTPEIIPAKLQTRPGAFIEATASDLIDPTRLRSKKVSVTVHQIKMKENYWTIKDHYKIDIQTLIGGNPFLPFKASINQKVNILSRKGVLHTVGKSEKLSQIVELYGADEKILKDENGLSWWSGINSGDVLFIPDVKPVLMTKEWKNYFGQRGTFGVPFASWGKGWTSRFGKRTDPITGESRQHSGMDFKGKYGDEVYAAGTGRVVFAGVAGGYGNLIRIAHADKYMTYYGHLSKIYVKSGQKVRRGTLIGRVGATGRVTGPHLHFEIRKNGKAIDPLPLI